MEQLLCLHNAEIYTGTMNIPSGAVIVGNGKILDVVGSNRLVKLNLPESTRFIDLKGSILCPGFIDSHIHGFGGYETSDASDESILKISESLTEYGVTSFCPTIYTQEDRKFSACIKAGVRAVGREKGARIIGLHLEGPFISRLQSGAQDASALKEVDMERMRSYEKIGKGKITLITVAPELKNMRELAIYCLKKGIILSAGHTDASYENMLEGMQAGIMHSTHFFNAMRRLHHRDPGCIGAILIHPEISCEIIADGHHVHPALIKLLHRDKPLDKIVLVTDALGPTMQSEGHLMANGEPVYLEDEVFYRESDNVMAGSSLTMIKGIENLVSWGIPLSDAIAMATTNPARILGLDKDRGLIMPGHSADLTAFDEEFKILLTIVEGKIEYEL
ncbi:N-acetylglucosamine-6-phosphate deacetylase [Spirochaeta isovalerica]|uniref:N-acetylglucosamine-6-phosphate deacetylase n=1 Tax=Spirochaeta isovalerica TaxID=150 RepID=A0A841RFF4_9SPIO|nr:N-acetylglucosamine-6-phosphate deacetylase [Spirochaeta isovalerica]MBB6482121.1 N-acetylglucosamine-6-phosphate deacetylase [Spirochaeta isovalerica]